jgi:hypothetical protein
MRNNNRPTNNETARERLEDLGAPEAGVEQEKPAGDQVRFIDTLDAETRAQLDEVLEMSKTLARNVVAALNRGEDAD